jgi:DNA mismatch repair ATPase MutS
MEYTESYRNIFFAPFGVVLLWAFQFAFAIEEWRARDGARVKVWLDALAELEALLSLSGFAFEHPADVFPELDGGGPRFAGRGLTHPLLPQARAIRNDVSLSAERQLMLVSGSNMAGKSSLLRTVGVNTVLALAGSTVRAESLAVSRLAVGAAMRVQDSLQQGVSHFYAEIKRLRQIVELTEGEGRTALLFLFDEILHGTNSYDRSIGAEAVVRTLVERGAIGLVTTHDLALTRIVDHLGARALNVHFQDELVDGKMTFDYRLREGVVEKSNAIALMRAVGLEV